MRFETIPLIAGGLVALIGILVLADAWLPEALSFRHDRRRQERVERSTFGEACIGLAILCCAGALIGRDTWAYSTIAIIAGAVLFLIGIVKNWHYLRERITNRGALRRGKPVSRK